MICIVSGCSSFSFKDNLSDVAATGAATVCAVLDPTLGVACGVGTGIAVNAVTPIEAEVDIAQVTNVHQEEVAKAQVKADLIESVAIEGVIGVGIIFLLYTWLTWWLGARRPRPEDKAKIDESQRMVETLVKRVAEMKM